MLRNIVITARQCCKSLPSLLVSAKTSPVYFLEQVRTTVIVERLHPPQLAKKGRTPHLKNRNHFYKMVDRVHSHKLPDIQCILTDTVEGIGFIGELVTIKRQLFRSKLYPSGLAVYASPENLEKYSKQVKVQSSTKDSRLSISGELTLKQLAGMYLKVIMSGDNPWVLNKTHVRVALRRSGVEVKDECIILPEEPITEPQEITCKLIINNTSSVDVKGIIVLRHKDPSLDLPMNLPPNFIPTVRKWKLKKTESTMAGNSTEI